MKAINDETPFAASLSKKEKKHDSSEHRERLGFAPVWYGVIELADLVEGSNPKQYSATAND